MKSWMAIRHFATDAMHAAAVMNENEDMCDCFFQNRSTFINVEKTWPI